MTLLQDLAEDDRAALLRLGTARAYPAGATLISEGSRDTDIYLLLTGSCKVLGDTVDGRTVLVSVRTAGEIVGELAALDDRPRSATVETLVPLRARVICRAAFERYMAGRPAAARAVHTAVVTELRRATRHRILVGAAPVVTRLAAVLDLPVSAFGDSFEVPLSQPELASLIGVSEPSLQRALTTLRAQRIVQTRYRKIRVLDPLRLKEWKQQDS